MYERTMNTTITSYRVEYLTKQEHNRLKKMVLGYGKFKRVADTVTDMHQNTFRNIVDKGYGMPENIQRIRETLLATNQNAA